MKTIYCISGLGADERAFSKLKIEGYKLQVIRWLMPERSETLEHYAERMRESITENDPILMGLSFGGMVCTEIAKQIPVNRIILISSVKSSKEIPFWMKLVSALRLHKIFPLKSTPLTQPFQNRMLGVQTAEEKALVACFRREVDLPYTNWAVDKAINWKNEWQHPNTCHIHGTDDHMFPIKNIKPTYTVKKAGHFMIMNRADEVSRYINKVLQAGV
ncbi:MAG TPA: alpha/beta hydrolase [Ferruginibacter sp.]|jgi:pimeloyl-ACP methyl ester carboxylesterase|nr:alpha/beta hydrolase [Ferruginibacter sp.]